MVFLYAVLDTGLGMSDGFKYSLRLRIVLSIVIRYVWHAVGICSPCVLHYYSTFSWHAMWHWHGTTHGIPWHPHGSPWRGIGFHGTPWGVPWHAMGGTMGTPAATATSSLTALHGNPTACHGNPEGTPMPTAPRVKGSMVCREGSWKVRGLCRGRFCRRWCHGRSRKRTIMYTAGGTININITTHDEEPARTRGMLSMLVVDDYVGVERRSKDF